MKMCLKQLDNSNPMVFSPPTPQHTPQHRLSVMFFALRVHSFCYVLLLSVMSFVCWLSCAGGRCLAKARARHCTQLLRLRAGDDQTHLRAHLLFIKNHQNCIRIDTKRMISMGFTGI